MNQNHMHFLAAATGHRIHWMQEVWILLLQFDHYHICAHYLCTCTASTSDHYHICILSQKQCIAMVSSGWKRNVFHKSTKLFFLPINLGFFTISTITILKQGIVCKGRRKLVSWKRQNIKNLEIEFLPVTKLVLICTPGRGGRGVQGEGGAWPLW